MAGSVNKVILVGNLGADPEIRRTQDGRPVANLRIATSETWRDKNAGERRERTEWHRVVIFSEGLAKVAEQYLTKGARIYVEGQLQTRKWQDQQTGQDRWSTDVVLQGFNSQLVMLDRAVGGGVGARDDFATDNGAADYGYGSYADGSRSGMPAPARQPATAGGSARDDMNDEVPF
jgi:single-strand DNA-binding protein